MRVLDLFAGLGGWSAPARARGHDVCTTDLDPRFGCDITADVLELEADDVRAVLDGDPDLILASPPCEKFSVLQIGRHWTGPKDVPPHVPKTEEAKLALRLVERTRELIAELRPAFFVIENPRAKLRRLPVVADLERRTVTYCRLGERFNKPTDLWGGFPPSLVLPEPCRTKNTATVEVDGFVWRLNEDGEPCHIAAPRGSTTGIQGVGTLAALQVAIDGLELSPQDVSALEGAGKFRGGLIEELRRYASGSSERLALSALRARIPDALAELVLDAAERDLDAGDVSELETRLF